MEARTVHAERIYTSDNNHERVWHIIQPHKRGIRVNPSQIPPGYGLCNLSPSINRFITDIAGKGGPWDGWTLYALGNLRWTDGPNSRRDDPTPYFDMIFVRKERTAEGKANERSGEENRQDGERMSAERSQLTSEGAEDRKFPKR